MLWTATTRAPSHVLTGFWQIYFCQTHIGSHIPVALNGPVGRPFPRPTDGVPVPLKEAHRVRFVLDRALGSIGLLGPTEIGLSLGLGPWGPKQIGLLLGLGLWGPRPVGLWFGLGLLVWSGLGLGGRVPLPLSRHWA
jgi:hypothetical protein